MDVLVLGDFYTTDRGSERLRRGTRQRESVGSDVGSKACTARCLTLTARSGCRTCALLRHRRR